MDCLKLNMDGAVFSELQIAGVGVIVRDHAGKAILEASIPEASVANAKTIEAIAILRGLQICMHQGISKLINESDCLVVIEEISSHADSNTELGNVLLDIKELMSRFSYSVRFNTATGWVIWQHIV